MSTGPGGGTFSFAEAGVTAAEMDIAMIYDSFSITVLTLLEDLGFCAKGEGGAWVEGGRLRGRSGMRSEVSGLGPGGHGEITGDHGEGTGRHARSQGDHGRSR